MNIMLFLILSALLTPPFTAANPQDGGYAIQVEATQDRSVAEQKVRQLKEQGLEAYWVKGSVPGKGEYYRVRIGRFPNKEAAMNFGASLKRQGIAPDFLLVTYQAPDPVIEARPSQRAEQPQPAPPQTAQSNTWMDILPGETKNGVLFRRDGTVSYYGNVLGKWDYDKTPDISKVALSSPTPKRGLAFIMFVDSDHGGIQGYVVDTRTQTILARKIVPDGWAIGNWISWSPDERYVLVAAVGEVTNGDMAFVDLTTGKSQEIHFKLFTRSRRRNVEEEMQYFRNETVVWINQNTFGLRLDIGCNPYEVKNCYDATKVLRSYKAQVRLDPFSITYP